MSPSSSSPGLGEFEYLVMLAVVHVGEEGYSVTIRKEIEKRTGRSVAPGALYVTLQRLTEKGLLESWLGDPTPERGGKAKRHFRPTDEGLASAREFTAAVRSMTRGLDGAFERG